MTDVHIDGTLYSVLDEKPGTLLTAVGKHPIDTRIFGVPAQGFDHELGDPTVDVAADGYASYYTMVKVEPIFERPPNDGFAFQP